MPGTALQFHATRTETAAWMRGCAREFGLHLAAEKFFPHYRANRGVRL